MSEPRKTIEELLSEARGRLRRLEPAEASAARSEGALLIDIRSEAQRAREGVVPGALFFPRNVLEWRCDPSSPSHDPRIGLERRLIVMCNEGYQSSLAAATLQELGFEQATDLAGGFQAWRAAGPRSARCSCGVEVEGEDDADLLLGLRDHFAAEHPAESPTDEQLRERIAASA
jgi:rhodanese-related sulfurtransferase